MTEEFLLNAGRSLSLRRGLPDLPLSLKIVHHSADSQHMSRDIGLIKRRAERARGKAVHQAMSVGWDQGASFKLDGDEPLLAELIAVFFEEYPTHAGDLHRALMHKDLRALQEAAHALAGSLDSLGATDAKSLALELERVCQSRDFAAAAELTERLRANIDHLRRLLIEGEATHEAFIE